MGKIVSLAALFSAGSLLFSGGAWAQQGTESESYAPPPSAATEPAVPHNPEAQEPAVVSHKATEANSSEPSSEHQAQRANGPDQESIPLATSKPAQQQTLVSSGALVGTAVKNLQGEKLGDLRELMIDPQTGRVVYAVLASGGVLGMGEKSLAIPWETLKVGLGKEELIVEIDKDKLQTVPPHEMSQR
jgi:sporulation protein YlmC with PRC-barrel domain